MTDHCSTKSDPLVLLVEDDALVRMVTAEIIADAGFSVIEAADAAEALAYLDTGNVPDVLVTDVRMPGEIDGLGLAKMVRERWTQMGVLVCSAHASPTEDELPPRALFLPKPHAPGALVRHVATLVSQRSLLCAANER